jgi:hypothetical protein
VPYMEVNSQMTGITTVIKHNITIDRTILLPRSEVATVKQLHIHDLYLLSESTRKNLSPPWKVHNYMMLCCKYTSEHGCK